LLALWARDARTRTTIATYVSEPAYPNLVYGQADLVGTPRTLISGDFPGYAEALLEQRLGGIAILASGSLANQASPMQADIAASPDLPAVAGHAQTRGFDDIIQMASAVASVTFGALARAVPMTHVVVGGAEQYVVAPVTDAASIGLAVDNEIDNGAVFSFTTYWGTDRAVTPPYSYGAALGTWVTALRIGDVAVLSEPGEFFGSIREAWAGGIGAAGVFVVGAAQDFLGYVYPLYVLPFTNLGGDEFVFGPAPTLGDQVVVAGDQAARQLGFAVDPTATAESTATEQDYSRVAHAGAYLLPSAIDGDLDRSTGAFAPTFVAAGSPPRASTICTNPALLLGPPPGCTIPEPPISAFQWQFGDGSGGSTPAQALARAWFSPFVVHSFTHPGRYVVSVAVSADGSSDEASLPVTVHPALRAGIARRGHNLVATVSGGDGHILAYRWKLADGRELDTASVAAGASGPTTLIVVDGTGASATASSAA
jgi:hypothetical protein